jgi:hypothetical protein
MHLYPADKRNSGSFYLQTTSIKQDHASAIERVGAEYVQLTNKLWEGAKNADPAPYHVESLESKASYLLHLSYRNDNEEYIKLSMLNDLLHQAFWHAGGSLFKLWPGLEKEDRDFYVGLVLNQARSDSSRFGNLWIVETYEKEKLSGAEKLGSYLTETDLKDATNRAFWEFVNRYYTTAGYTVPLDKYALLEKYFVHLDFSRTKELRSDRPLLSSSVGWPTEAYVKAFEGARASIDMESAAWLAHPIIDQAIRRVVYPETMDRQNMGLREMIKNAEGSLEQYQKYIGNPLLQSLFAKWLTAVVASLDSYDNDSRNTVAHIDFLFRYIAHSSEEEKKEMISLRLPKDNDLYRQLIEAKFPVRMLTESVLRTVRERLLAELDNGHLDRKNLREFINLARNATLTGFLDLQMGKNLLRSALDAYAGLKPRPNADLVFVMQRALDDLFELSLIEREDYREKGEVCISDLKLKKKRDAAYELERILKAVGEGSSLDVTKRQIAAEHSVAERSTADARRRERRKTRGFRTRATRTRHTSGNDPDQLHLDCDFTNLEALKKAIRKRS